jgi:RNA polymerase sigma-70 factor (ECF subfamily)
MASDDISGLIERISLGDRNAFSRLYDLTSAKLFAICVRILKDRNEAEEALQEIYVKIWQRAQRFAAGQGSPMSWLSAIARHQAIDMIRARRPVSTSIDDVFDLADEAPGPETAAIHASDGKRIDRCMQQLEADRAEAVRKAYVEGMSYQELADHYHVPVNTMRTWLRRSLLRLRECLQS